MLVGSSNLHVVHDASSRDTQPFSLLPPNDRQRQTTSLGEDANTKAGIENGLLILGKEL